MLAKRRSKNQVTLPKRAVEMLGAMTHFQLEVEGDRLGLTRARLGAAGAVRQKLREPGVTEADVADAVACELALLHHASGHDAQMLRHVCGYTLANNEHDIREPNG